MLGNWEISVTSRNIQIFLTFAPDFCQLTVGGSIDSELMFLFLKIEQNPPIVPQFTWVYTCVLNFRQKFQYFL